MHSISYGNQKIEFEILYTNRKTLEISVFPNKEVLVKAPENSELEKIFKLVEKRARWIVKQRNYFDNIIKNSTTKEYVSGESFKYLGKQYRLKVYQIEKSEKECVKLIGGYIRVFTKEKVNTKKVKKLVDFWYRNHALKKFEQRLKICFETVQKYGIEFPEFELRKMKTRWGSCLPDGKIILNPKLIEAPTYCIDYVIFHELCHILYPNHNKEFYGLLDKILPKWKNYKNRLALV